MEKVLCNDRRRKKSVQQAAESSVEWCLQEEGNPSEIGNIKPTLLRKWLKCSLANDLFATAFCSGTSRPSPNYNIVSDRRGKRTAWSCTVDVPNGTQLSILQISSSSLLLNKNQQTPEGHGFDIAEEAD